MRIPNTETFLIPFGTLIGKPEDEFAQILYSPLQGELSILDKEASLHMLECEHEADEVMQVPLRDITKTRRMSILPNLKCNFSCSYCYSAQGRSNKEMEWDTARAAIDYFIDSKRIDPGDIRIFISGGGEPVLSWPLTERIITYSHRRAQEQGFVLYIGLITNASLINEDIARTLCEFGVTVGVSFEVLEDLQNQQRKSFEKVSRGIEILLQQGCTVKVNSTITPYSVHRMQEMLLTIARRYPQVAAYTMEPVTSVELFGDEQELRAFYDSFFDEYVQCRKLADEYGLPLRFTFDDEYRGSVVRHCPGKFCITPTGAISVCHLVSSPKEQRFAECTYGMVDADGVRVDMAKFAHLYDRNVLSYPECKDCFAKWSCGGECLTRRSTYPDGYMKEVCRFNRRILLHQLIAEIRSVVQEEYGQSLEEF